MPPNNSQYFLFKKSLSFVAYTGLEILVLLPLPPMFWEPRCPIYTWCLGPKTQGLMHARQALFQQIKPLPCRAPLTSLTLPGHKYGIKSAAPALISCSFARPSPTPAVLYPSLTDFCLQEAPSPSQHSLASDVISDQFRMSFLDQPDICRTLQIHRTLG